MSKENHFLNLAQQLASQATCDRLHVGAILVRDGYVISTGYNGAPVGLAHCCDVGCQMVAGHCVRSVHAECNAIASAARLGVSTAGSVMYVTHEPCVSCYNLGINAGVRHFVYRVKYGTDISFPKPRAYWLP